MATDRNRLDQKRKGTWTRYLWAAAAVVLLIPFIAMRMTSEVSWTEFDFIVMGALLAVTCGIIELAARRAGSHAYLLGVAAAVGGGFFIVWANLAVGHEHGPYDMYFYGAMAIGAVIAAVARFRPRGMLVAMLAIAAALVVALRLMMSHETDLEGSNLLVTTFASGAIASPFLVAAWLFRMAAGAR